MRNVFRKKTAAAGSLLFLLSTLLTAAPSREQGPEYRVNLNDRPLYVRSGFSPEDLVREPSDGGTWKRFPPSEGGRSLRFTDLGLTDMPRRPFLDLRGREIMEFTYLIPFDLAPETVGHRVPGMHLASLGDVWEIYLNGVLLISEFHLDGEGNIAAHRNRRDIYFPIDPALLNREGGNILAVRMAGDPSYPPTGFYYAEPYFLAPYESIVSRNSEVLEVALCGVYVFVGLYHLFLFLMRRKDRHNLFYGIFSLLLGLYLFVRTHTVYGLIPDGAAIVRLEFGLLFMVLPVLGAFVDTISINKVRKATLVYGAFCLTLAALQAVLSLPFGHDLLTVWQVSGLVMAVYFFGYTMLWEFLSSTYRRWKRYREAEQPRSLAGEYLKALAESPLGNLLLGATILFATAIYDIVDAMFFYTDVVATRYGFFLFTIGTALVLANRYGFLQKQLSLSNQNLERRIDDLNVAKAKVERNERKYRSLFDGTTEPVALVDERFRFLECNAAAADFFNLEGVSLEYTSDATPTLPSRLYEDKRERITLSERFDRALQRLRLTGAPLELAAQVRSPIGEFTSCTLRMEHIRSAGEHEILVRVIPEKADSLAAAFVEGRERYDIESALSAADEVCLQACARLPRYVGQEDANFLRVCLREIVLNAIEHGNLEINFEEKTRAQRDRSYFEFLQKRKEDPKYRSRRVVVEYSVTSERALFRVTDCGPGFDHRKFLRAAAAPGPELLEHGRGLFMTLAAFDRVSYNEKGNQVTLEKKFAKA